MLIGEGVATTILFLNIYNQKSSEHLGFFRNISSSKK